MSIPQGLLIAVIICFGLWAIVNIFIREPTSQQDSAARLCGLIGIVLLGFLAVGWYSQSVRDDAHNQLTKQGYEVISMQFGSENQQGTATVKYHGCIGVFEFREVSPSMYQVGEVINGVFVELTNVEKPHWISCPQPANNPPR